MLERYQVDPPEAIDDVYLQVRDVMRRGVTCAYLDQSLLEAGQLLQEQNRRSMPVVDAENKVHGIIATEDFAKLFFNDLDPRSVNRVPLKRDNLVRVLRGRVLVEGRRTLGNRVLVAAMQAETMVDYIEPGCLVVLGDREDAQIKAIESGARGDRRPAHLRTDTGQGATARRAGHQDAISHLYCRAPAHAEHERAGAHVSRFRVLLP